MKHKKIFNLIVIFVLIVSFVSSCGNHSSTKNTSAHGDGGPKTATTEFENVLQDEFDCVISVLNRYSRIHYDFYYSYYADEETNIQVLGQERLDIFKAMTLDELSIKVAKNISAEEFKKTFEEFIDNKPHTKSVSSESDFYDNAFCYMFYDTGAYDPKERQEGLRTLAVYFLGRVFLQTGVIE